MRLKGALDKLYHYITNRKEHNLNQIEDRNPQFTRVHMLPCAQLTQYNSRVLSLM
jgi:hypothetical protein